MRLKKSKSDGGNLSSFAQVVLTLTICQVVVELGINGILYFFVSGEHRHHSHCSLWVESSGRERCLQGLIFSSWVSME